MSRDFILDRIKETESNINNWYKERDESDALCEYYLKIEKNYLRFLKSKLTGYSEERTKELMDKVECFI